MKDVDLSHVDPRHLAETKRRVALVREYAAIAHPSGQDAKRFATALGLSTSHLSRLVKAWREYGRLPGRDDSERRSNAVRTSGRGIPEASRRTVERTVNALGLDARFTDLALAAREACIATGVVAPAPASIWLMIQKLRDERGALVAQSHRGILVARCRLEMKVRFGELIVMPEILIAVALPECRVIDTLMVRPTAGGSGCRNFAVALASLVGRDVDGRPLLADEISMGGHRLPTTLAGVVTEDTGTTAFDLLMKSVGRKLDTLLIAPIARKNIPARLNRTAVFDPEQARDTIAHAVDRHNARRPEPTNLRMLTKASVTEAGPRFGQAVRTGPQGSVAA